MTTALLTLSANAATIIVSDDFDAPDAASFAGRTPVTDNVPDAVWQKVGHINGLMAIKDKQAQIGADDAAVISIASIGSYIKPRYLHISASLDNNGDTSDDGFATRGLLLGFYDDSDIPAITGNRNATGITYSPSGVLRLVDDGVIVESLPGFSASGPHTLAYSIDTNTGQVYEVAFDGKPVSFKKSTVVLSETETNHAGVTANSMGSAHFFSHFLLTEANPPTAP